MTVRTPRRSWIVPTHRGVWVPARTRHTIYMSGPVAMRTLYFWPGLSRSFPDECNVVGVSALLRELVLHAVALGGLNQRISTHAHLTSVILDHLRTIASDAVLLPMPKDRRARRIASALEDDPADRRALPELSKGVGASRRTIERMFKLETGLSFGKWRQQLRLGHALRLLAAGDAVTTVAMDVGYDSISAFISAFRMTFGKTPGQYFRSA